MQFNERIAVDSGIPRAKEIIKTRGRSTKRASKVFVVSLGDNRSNNELDRVFGPVDAVNRHLEYRHGR